MRIEKDSIGELKIPNDAYYGIQSYRASQNFPISGTQVHLEFIRSYLLLKKAAAKANHDSPVLDGKLKDAIVFAVDDLLKSHFEKHFIIDAYQAGAGTSQNMNVNEVIANRANELLGGERGSYYPIHPNDHVNQSQSTNDTYPTVMRLTSLVLSKYLKSSLDLLAEALNQKSLEFDSIVKAGRTHLQDAVPIRLGQEFSGYRDTVIQLSKLLMQAQDALRELGIGGSAVGTGINVPEEYPSLILEELKILFDDADLRSAPNLFQSMQSQLPMMHYSSALRLIALELIRIFNDLRLLSSGPNDGLGEIQLPSAQPGSSIMPGKVNPSLLEMGTQVCFKVLGNDAAMSFAMQAGQLELNVMMPLMAQVALESTHILTGAIDQVQKLCIRGIEANKQKCEQYALQTSQILTALTPLLGYEQVAALTKEAKAKNKLVLDLIKDKKILNEGQISSLVNLRGLTH